MSNQPKVLCLISHGYYKPWIDIAINGQNTTWLAHDLPSNFQVLNYHGTPLKAAGQWLDKAHERIRWSNRYFHLILKYVDLVMTSPFWAWMPDVSPSKLMHLNHETIHVNVRDSYLTFRWKAKGAFKYILETYDFDFVFMTTTSSYIRPSRLLDILGDAPRREYLGGARAYAGANFAAGSNRILSRDLIQYLVDHPRSYLPYPIEDLSLSKSLIAKGIEINFMPHLDIPSISDLDKFTDQELLNNYHFRLKSGSIDHRGDVAIMKALDQRLLEIEMPMEEGR
jgi:hypothetical protein